MIHFREVHRNYRMGSETVHALKNINLTIEEGQFVSLIGHSGSGKTTLLNLIGGLERPSSGEVTVFGKNLGHLNDAKLSEYRRQSIGYIFQTFNLLPRLTVLKNVMLAAEINGTPKKEGNKTARLMLKAVGLEDKLNYLPNKLSGGERQRVAIARALVNNPSIILADEPTGNLDEFNAEKILTLLIKLTKEANKTLVLVTHNPELSARADYAISLHTGRIVKENK